MSGDGLDDDDDDDDDDDGSDFDIDETDLESYSTVLEANEDIDEFQIFCESLQSKLVDSSIVCVQETQFIFFSFPKRIASRYDRLQSSIATKFIA